MEDNPRQSLNRVIIGAVVFFFGVLLIYGAEKFMPTSSRQELIALAGLLSIGGGAILSLRGYLGLSILRIFRFLDDQRH